MIGSIGGGCTKKLLNADEVSEILGINRARTWGLARLYERTKGKHGLPCIRLGIRQMRFSRAAIERFLEGRSEIESKDPGLNL